MTLAREQRKTALKSHRFSSTFSSVDSREKHRFYVHSENEPAWYDEAELRDQLDKFSKQTYIVCNTLNYCTSGWVELYTSYWVTNAQRSFSLFPIIFSSKMLVYLNVSNITNTSCTVLENYNNDCKKINSSSHHFHHLLRSLGENNWMWPPQTAGPYGIVSYWPADHRGYSSINQCYDECVCVSISILRHCSAVLGLELTSPAP